MVMPHESLGSYEDELVPVPGHPSWCAADLDGIHYSQPLPPWPSERVIDVAPQLFRMDGLPVPLVGVSLRIRAADEEADYPIDLDQARMLVWALGRLIDRAKLDRERTGREQTGREQAGRVQAG